jgi:hypothetical protein
MSIRSLIKRAKEEKKHDSLSAKPSEAVGFHVNQQLRNDYFNSGLSHAMSHCFPSKQYKASTSHVFQKLGSIPDLYFATDFVTKDEEQALLWLTDLAPQSDWTVLSAR